MAQWIMDADQPMNLEPLSFSRFSMHDGVPVSMLFSMAGNEHRCGIYILEFADGAQYVGQTINIVRRYSDHQHNHGDVVAFSFAACDRESLDAYERVVIKLQQQGHDLRNKLLTDVPGGRGDLVVEISEKSVVKLPWHRKLRSTINDEPRSSKEGRYWLLSARPDYPEIRRQLARYIHATIPSPLETAGLLWTLTGLPSTSKTTTQRRLLTLNVSNVEALYVTEYDLEGGESELEWVVNAWPTGLPEKLEDLNGEWLDRAFYEMNNNYASAGPVVTIVSVDTATCANVFDQGFILDAAYQLNVTMMRRSKSVFAKFHNHSFAADIFREVAVNLIDLRDQP